MPVAPQRKNERTLKKIRTAKASSSAADELLPEYRFDYRKAKPNLFAAEGDRAVLLDADVAAVSSTAESVNAVLRALIETTARARELGPRH